MVKLGFTPAGGGSAHWLLTRLLPTPKSAMSGSDGSFPVQRLFLTMLPLLVDRTTMPVVAPAGDVGPLDWTRAFSKTLEVAPSNTTPIELSCTVPPRTVLWFAAMHTPAPGTTPSMELKLISFCPPRSKMPQR